MANKEWDIQSKRRLTDYLAQVDEALASSGKSEAERADIVEDIEAQAYAMVEEAVPEGPTPETIVSVLAQLSPPSDYASAPSETAAPPRLSRKAIARAVWAATVALCLGLVLFGRIRVVSLLVILLISGWLARQLTTRPSKRSPPSR